MMKKIHLTQNKVALVDGIDYEVASKIRWYAWFNPSTHSFYAVVSIQKDNKKKTTYLHRLLMNPPKGKVVDHINKNTLDNRRKNLRVCTQRDNIRASKGRPSASGFKGVFWNKILKKWQGKIYVDGKSIHLGVFQNKELGAIAYNNAAKKYFGEFAHLNKIKPWKKKKSPH